MARLPAPCPARRPALRSWARRQGTAGAVGPVLDELKPDAQRVPTALRNGIGTMPSFRDKLSDAQIAALAAYVAAATGAAK